MINVELSTANGQILLLNETEYNGLDNAQLSFAVANGQTAQTTFVSNLELFGRAAQMVKDELLAANDISKYIIIKFFDDCCTSANGGAALVFVGRFCIQDLEFEVDNETLETCAFKVNISSAMPTDEFTTCLKNTIIPILVPYEKTHYFKANVELRPYATQTMLFALYYLIKVPLFVLMSVVRAIVALLRMSNVIHNDNFLNTLDTFALPQHNQIGFGIIDTINRACVACNGALSYDAALFGGQIDKLYRIDSAFAANGSSLDSMRKGWKLNAPNITIIDLLDSFASANMVWDVRITNNLATLHLNQKTHANNTHWLDVTTRPNDLVSMELVGNDKTQIAGRLIEYQSDGMEKHGDTLKRYFDRIIDFNTPANPLRKGIETITIPYTLARSFADEYDALGSAANDYQNTIGTIAPLYYDRRALMLANDTYLVPKLVVADGTGAYNTQLYPFITNGSMVLASDGTYKNPYQWSLQLHQARNTGAPSHLFSLYDSQFANDEPSQTTLYSPFTFTIVMQFGCNDIATLHQSNKIIRFFENGRARAGVIDTVDFDLKTGQMTIKGNC